ARSALVQRALDALDRLLDVALVDVPVGTQSNGVLAERRRTDSFRGDGFDERLGRVVGLDENDVRLGWCGGETVDGVETGRERPGVHVLLGESVDVVERLYPRSGDDPCLTHPATEQFPVAVCTLDERLAPGEHRADGRAEPLRETEHHRVCAVE